MRPLWILVGVLFALCDFVKSQDTGRNLYNSSSKTSSLKLNSVLRYDHLNVKSILSSSRLVSNYVDCLLNKKPCPPEGKDLKRILPDALRTKCSRCSVKQKENALKIIRTLYEDYPSKYQELRAKWDQTGEYHRRFEEYLRDEQFNTINNSDRPRPPPRPASNGGVNSNNAGQSQVNIQRVLPNVAPVVVNQPTTQRVFTPRPSVVTAPPQPTRSAPAVIVPQNRPVQNQIPPIARDVPQEQQPQQQQPNNFNAPTQNLVPPQAQTQRPDRSPSVAQNTNKNTLSAQADTPVVSFSSRFGDDEDDEDQQPPAAPAVSLASRSSSSSNSASSSSSSSSSMTPAATNTNTDQNTQKPNPNTNNDGLVNVNDIRTPSTTIKTTVTVVGIPPNIIDNFFVSPSINTYQPQGQPIQGLFNRIGTKVVNTAAFVGGMLRATVQVFVGNGQQQQQVQFQV